MSNFRPANTRLSVSALFALGLLFVLSSAGCMTSGEGDALRKDLMQLQKSLSKTQVSAEKQLQKLQEVMEQATALLTRNNADVGAQVDRLQRDVAKVTGATEENTKALQDLSKRFADFQAKVDVKLENLSSGAPQKKQPPVPEDKNKLFGLAQGRINAGKHQEGRRLLRHFVARFEKDARVPNAWLQLGNSYYAQGKFANAIQEYRKVIEKYKRSKVVPEALYKIGMSFYQLKYCSDARVFFSELTRRHRRHPAAKSAHKTLKLIRRYRRNRRFCLN
ncbi:MAG: tetratricopeptide repeat protein [Deltaproteobacteria bacterium]|nr:tetratricopeptide repeat protein [Deltaproteobacteria bacterium]